MTVGGRNLIGTRDLRAGTRRLRSVDADETTTTIPRVPGEGRELYVKVGYRD